MTEKQEDGTEKIVGVRILRESLEVCKTEVDDTTYYGIEHRVMCDATITGPATIVSVDMSDECVPITTVKHAGGCHTITASKVVLWISDNPIALGVFCIIIGAITAMCGKRWFPWIAASYGALTVIDFVIITSSELGYMDSIMGISLTLLIALVPGIIAGMLIRRFIWVAVGFNGIVVGACFGVFIYTIILALADWMNLIGSIVLVSVGAVVGGFLACKFGQEIVLYGTSFIGSYYFMRGWTFILGGYPSEPEIATKLVDGENIHLTIYFWIYVAVFIALFIFTS